MDYLLSKSKHESDSSADGKRGIVCIDPKYFNVSSSKSIYYRLSLHPNQNSQNSRFKNIKKKPISSTFDKSTLLKTYYWIRMQPRTGAEY